MSLSRKLWLSAGSAASNASAAKAAPARHNALRMSVSRLNCPWRPKSQQNRVSGAGFSAQPMLEHFQEEWHPVFSPKMGQRRGAAYSAGWPDGGRTGPPRPIAPATPRRAFSSDT